MEQVQINNMVKKVISALEERTEKADLVFPRQIEPLVDQGAWDEVMDEANIMDTSQAVSSLYERINQSDDISSVSVSAQQAKYLVKLSHMDYVEHQLYWDAGSALNDDTALPLNTANMVDYLYNYIIEHPENEKDKNR